jgi:hypothetical protein
MDLFVIYCAKIGEAAMKTELLSKEEWAEYQAAPKEARRILAAA